MVENIPHLIFSSFQEAALHAKRNPGMILKRLDSGKGWQVLPKHPKILSQNRHQNRKANNNRQIQEQDTFYIDTSVPTPYVQYNYNDYYIDEDIYQEMKLIEKDLDSDSMDYARTKEEGWFYKD